MNYDDLTPEQMEKAKACKSVEELLALAASEGMELSDEEISAISGGVEWYCKSDSCDEHWGRDY